MTALKKPVPFGKYYLLERINVGGMAEVFKAKAFGVEGFERLLAVKRILPNIAEDEEFITMFIDEAKIAVQLQHANIAQIFDLGQVDDSYFIALEYVHGKDLRAIFDRCAASGEPLPIAHGLLRHRCRSARASTTRTTSATRRGASCTSSTATSRRRTSSSAYEGEVKLIDFGIAKAAGKASKTQAGILKGKFGYMSPEQVRGLPIDRRSDIFAVGIVLYELLTGERLFVGESDFSTLEKVRNVEILPPSSYNQKIPRGARAHRAQGAGARIREDRYQNAIDLHDDLQAFLYTVGEFYSRKDLAGWMKKTFAMEIEEDNAKLEEYRQLAPPVAAGAEVSRRAAVGRGRPRGAPARAAPPPRTPAKATAKQGQAAAAPATRRWGGTTRSWTPRSSTRKRSSRSRAEDLFFEDDDRTVANEPPPDILEQARPPELLTPKPIDADARRAERGHQDDAAAAGAAAAAAARRAPADAGGRSAGAAADAHAPGRHAAPDAAAASGAGPPPGRAGLRRSGLNLPPRAAPCAVAAASRACRRRCAPPPPPRPQRFHAPQRGAVRDRELRRPSSPQAPGAARDRTGCCAVGGRSPSPAMVYWYNSNIKPGRIELTDDARRRDRLIDNVKVGDHSPVSLEQPPGPYTLSVTRDGYARNDQNIELKAGQPLPLTVTLEPSPDTGFELTSDPPGGLVWLDGAPMKERRGSRRAPTSAPCASPRAPRARDQGRERFKPWQQDVEIEPGDIRKIHATLIPAVGGPGGRRRQEPGAAGHGAAGGARQQAAVRRRRRRCRRPQPPPRDEQPARGSRPSRPRPLRRRPARPPRPAAGSPSAPTTPERASDAREAPPRDDDRGEEAPARSAGAAQDGRAADDSAAAAATARSRSTRSPGPRSGSTARTPPSTRRSSTSRSLAASTSSRSSAPTCRSIRPRASTFYAGDRRLNRTPTGRG